MVSLIDIVPQTRMVETAHGTIELHGLGVRRIANLLLRFPEIRKIFSGNAPEIDAVVLMTEMPDAIGAIIAEAAEQPESAERIADVFSPDDAAACLVAVQEMTVTPPFFDRLAALLGNSGASGRPRGREAVMSSPPPPSN